MNRSELIAQIKAKKSFLCIGLDTDINLIPQHLLDAENPIFEFNKQIIDATKDLCVAYKPNLAFYESFGVKGWEALQKTLNYIPNHIFTIADAKRGDIGNTSAMYAKAFFETMNFDSVTVTPYMGKDSVSPFFLADGKWVILLVLTSNEGGKDFQLMELEGKALYQRVLETSSQWGNASNMMYVVGATRADWLADIRKMIPNHFILVPGVGAQGGRLEEVAKYGLNKDCGLLVNSSRGIIYASDGDDFAAVARQKALALQMIMEQELRIKHVI